MRNGSGGREAREIRDLAKQFESEGYTVEVDPSPDQLPEALRGLRPDLIAERADQKVVVEVTTSPLEEKISRIASVVEKLPGWRFDLIVVGEDIDVATEGSSKKTPPDRRQAARRAYLFLRGREGAVVSVDEIVEASGWTESTVRTYIAKNWQGWLVLTAPRKYIVRGLNLVTEEEFLSLQSQVRMVSGGVDAFWVQKLEEAVRRGEGAHIEFKESIPKNASSLAQEIAAFATNGGGHIFLGVRDDGTMAGLDSASSAADRTVFRERIEGIARRVDPEVAPDVVFFEYSGRQLCVVNVPNGSEPVYYADQRPYVRTGSQSRPGRPDEVKELIATGQRSPDVERHRPLFGRIPGGALRRLEESFEPSWRIEHVAGDTPANLEWRFRGPRFGGETNDWRQVPVTALPQHHIVGVFNLAGDLKQDDIVERNEIGLELRFEWLGRTCFELHRWTIRPSESTQKSLWDIGDELPLIRGDLD